MEVSMTDPLFFGGMNGMNVGVWPSKGEGVGAPLAIPVPPVPPVPVYDMIVTGRAVLGGFLDMVVGGFDRTLATNALLHSEPWAPGPPDWGTPRAIVFGPAPFVRYSMNAPDDIGVWNAGVGAWLADAVGGGFGAVNSIIRPFFNGVVLGRMVFDSGGGLPADVYFENGLGWTPWAGFGGLPGLEHSVYGTWLNGHALLSTTTPALFCSTAPGNPWNLSSFGMVGGMAVEITPGTVCTSLTDRNVIYFIHSDFMAGNFTVWWSNDEGQNSAAAGLLPLGLIPTIMLATGPVLAGLLILADGASIWRFDMNTWTGVQTYIPPAFETIEDMWWDEATGRIWALVSPVGAGNLRIIISDDQGATWATWYLGPGFGANVGELHTGLGFAGQFR